MSSMFKKKTGLAFKPKIRPRPAAAQSAPSPAPEPAEVPTIDQSKEKTPEDVHDQAVIDVGNIARETPETSRPLVSKVLEESSTGRPPTPPPTAEQAIDKPQSIPDGDAAPAAQKGVSQLPETAAEIAPPEVHAPSETALAPTPTEDSPAAGDSSPKEAPHIEEIPETSAAREENPVKTAKARAPRPTRKATVEKSSESSEVTTPQTRKRQRKAPANGSPFNGEDGTEDGEAPDKSKRRRATISSASKPRRARSLTPEGAESQMVDLAKLKMSDLTEDLRIGKKFSRHDELRERERKRRLKARLIKGGVADEEEGDEQRSDKSKEKTPGPQDDDAQQNGAGPSGPQFRIVDGQIIVDQSSLVMDRHARAAANQGNMETVEENDFTRLITSSSFSTNSKLKGPNIWSETETELFYRALRMFGTDFEMMSRMFTGKKRRHVKLKFNREERHNPHLVDAALTGEKTVKMDIEEYKALTGTEFESVESIEAEQRKIQEGYEAEQKRIADEQAEIMRKKREELFADDEDEGKKKKKGKKKKQVIEYGLNGEPIRIEEAA